MLELSRCLGQYVTKIRLQTVEAWRVRGARQQILQALRSFVGPEWAIDTESDNLREIVEKTSRGNQDRSATARDQPFAVDLLQRENGVLVEHVRMLGGMNELQILRHELEIDETATDVLQIPDLVRTLLSSNSLAHVAHVGGNLGAVAWTDQNITDRLLDPRPQLWRPGDDARPRERHVLPGPCVVRLIFDEA